MSARDPVWRAILTVERILPGPAFFAHDPADQSSRRRYFVVLALLPVWLMPLINMSVRDHGGGLRALWPVWHLWFEGLALTLALAALAAALLAGLVTRRREMRDDR